MEGLNVTDTDSNRCIVYHIGSGFKGQWPRDDTSETWWWQRLGAGIELWDCGYQLKVIRHWEPGPDLAGSIFPPVEPKRTG